MENQIENQQKCLLLKISNDTKNFLVLIFQKKSVTRCVENRCVRGG